jgi:putative transposase
MSNYRRWRAAGGTYFFTVVAHERQAFLNDEPARRALRHALTAVRRSRPFELDAIVLLPDHLHAIWTLPPGDADYATRWRLIKSSFTHRYFADGGCESPRSLSRHAKRERGVWQRRYFEHTVRDDAT